LAIEYLSYKDVVFFHFDQMFSVGETRIGVFDRTLIQSALARPEQSAAYENADIIRQAATLYLGFIKNHPWNGGNKRTASATVAAFLMINDYEIRSEVSEIIELVLAIESDEFGVDETESWLRKKVVRL
jgi:death on curing protein